MAVSSSQSLLVVGFPSWKDDYVKSTLLLCTELARDFKLLYVEYPYTWKDVAMGMIGKKERPVNRIMGWESRLRKVETYHGATLHVLTLPPILPINWINNKELFYRMAELNAKTAKRSILKTLYTLDMESPIMVNAFNPFLGKDLQGKLGESLSIYYCYDEIGHARWAGKYGKMLENELLQKVDGLICSSVPLMEERQKIQPNAYVVKNGVYVENFTKAIKLRKNSPHESLTMGYWGAIDDRMDFELLDYCLAAFPSSELLLVGGIHDAVKGHPLLEHPRVNCVGSQPPSEIYSFAAKMDVGLIPFVKNGFTKGIYPMKINEYMAAGMPVVSTNFGDLSDFDDSACVANNEEEFVEGIKTFSIQNSPEDIQKRLEIALSNSWQERGRAFSSILKSLKKREKELLSQEF
ncbi:MAG: glycosyltransferase [Bacteroidia bacterium]|nr:glycosyltransferase [Bacteroidia bacterium]